MAAIRPCALPDDDDVARLLRRLLPLEADVALRGRVVRAKCEQLARVLAYVDRACAARARAHQAAQAETRELESSIGDAVRRARRIRRQLASAAPNGDSDDDAEASDDDDETGELRGILAQARGIRLADGATGGEAKEASSSSPPRVTRIEYPRRLKTLLDQLDDYAADERAQPFRAAFCRKMTEHLSMRESYGGPANGGSGQDERVQIGYALQVERIRAAYRHVGDYLEAKASPHNESVQKALSAPSISSVYPVYSRLKMARALLGELHAITTNLAQRLPPRPSLSQAAISHRDAMLDRLRKKAPSASEALATASNRLLITGPNGASELAEHAALLEKLQLAWEQERLAGGSTRSRPYSNAVGETILSELSTLVLAAFQTAFCEGTSAPSLAAISELMGVIRVAQSAVSHQARRQRSVVA